MRDRKERRAAVRFSAARFKRLPMAEKLAYLRSAFSALSNGMQVVDIEPPSRKASPQMVVESKPGGPLASPPMRWLSKSEFNRLTMDRKLEYLSRIHRDLEEAARKRGPTSSST